MILAEPMTNEDLVAPTLSTYQDDSTFEFARVQSTENARIHLGLHENEDYEGRLNEYYSIDELVDFLKQKDGEVPKYGRVTLQFPDSLVCDSATIVHLLQQKLDIRVQKGCERPANGCCSDGSKSNCSEKASSDTMSQLIWILADTSYSACCIDEVAAEHVKSNLVVHFGDACLNPVDKLPAVYVFGKPRYNLEDIVEKFKSIYDSSLKILLMADAPYTSVLGPLYNTLKQDYSHLAYADLHIDSTSKAKIIGYQPASADSSKVLLNRTFVGLEDELQEYELFHITLPETPRLLQLTTMFLSLATYDPLLNQISQGPFPNLMRRYRYMHMARAAGTVGLLVNTLSLANTKTLINSVGNKLKAAGKKHYIFVVGKPNVAKLANFENVEIWCVLGCDHQGIIVDQHNEYFRPIITPYELLLALSDEVTWTGKWVTDFNMILDDMNQNGEEEEKEKEDDDYSDEEPEFDPVTGRYVSTARPLRKLEHLRISSEPEVSDETALVKKLSTAIAIKNTVSTSAAHLQTRHWTGLGSDWQEDSDVGAMVEEGGSGVARGYDYDREVSH